MNTLADMPNIGPVLAEKLCQAGISTTAALLETGAEEAFLRIKAGVDQGACLHMLEALAGAVAGVRKSQLPPERKAELKRFYKAL